MRWRWSPAGTSAALLGLGLELSLEGGELGKRRVRIGRFLAPLVPFMSLRPQMGGRALAFAPRTIGPIRRALAALAEVTPFPGWRRACCRFGGSGLRDGICL